MLNAAIDLARLPLDSYKDKAGEEARIARIRESVYRELRPNAELASEAADVHTKQSDLARALLTQMPLNPFGAVFAARLRFTKTFPSIWTVADNPRVAPCARRRKAAGICSLLALDSESAGLIYPHHANQSELNRVAQYQLSLIMNGKLS